MTPIEARFPNRSRFQQPANPASGWGVPESIRRILVMRLDNIGDVILAGPALAALKASFPHATLTLMASPSGALAAPLLPWVDEVLPWRVLWQELGSLPLDPGREFEMVETLRQRRFDVAIVFTSFSQSPHPAAVVCRMAGIPHFAAQSKETGGVFPVFEAVPDCVHQCERNLRLLQMLGLEVQERLLHIQIPATAFEAAGGLLRQAGLEPGRPYLVFNPWASCQSRTYSPSRFAEAVRLLADRTGIAPVMTGLARDRERSAEALEILGERGIDLLGATNLPEFAALIARATLVLTSNTSALHLADAVRTPLVVLYSGTELEEQWAPRASRSILLRRHTLCTPCYRFTCPFEHECLDIPPEEIVDAALGLLGDALHLSTRLA
jgi:ADP-heptose:LPS heptosyltransferase